METERAPGSRELMTRGPSGNAVRSNIAADGTGRHSDAPTVAAGASGRRVPEAQTMLLIQAWPK